MENYLLPILVQNLAAGLAGSERERESDRERERGIFYDEIFCYYPSSGRRSLSLSAKRTTKY